MRKIILLVLVIALAYTPTACKEKIIMFIKMMRSKLIMKKITTLALVLAMTFTFAACSSAEPNLSAAEQLAEQNLTSTELTVWGMVCSGRCVSAITRAVSDVDGVDRVWVDWRGDLVTVVHEPDVDIDAIKDAITSEGFDVP
jgi:copper chaperone CopZ